MNAPLASDFELINFRCHECRQRYRAQPHWAGKSLRCKKCGVELTAPGERIPAPVIPRTSWPWTVALGCIGGVTITVAAICFEGGTIRDFRTVGAVAEADDEENFEIPEKGKFEPAVEPVPAPTPQQPVAAAAPAPPAPPAPKDQPPPAAPEDDPEATYKLGLKYETGDGVEKDTVAAAVCYEEAANAGHAESMYKIGLCHCIGKGVEKDEETGKEWLKEAAKLSHPDANLALEAFKVGIPAAIATAWITHPVGDGLRQKDKDKAQSGPSEYEAGMARMNFAYRLLGKKPPGSVYEPWRNFASPADVRQRDRSIDRMRQQQANANVQRSIRGK